MGGKSTMFWEVRRYRHGSYSILSKSKTSDMGYGALWGAVQDYLADMLDGEEILLLHGARVIVTIRMVGQNDVLELRRAADS